MKIDNPAKRSEGLLFGQKLFEELSKSPLGLNKFGTAIMKRDIFQYRDVALALKCLQQANKLTLQKDPVINYDLSKALYENGFLEKAGQRANQAKNLSGGERELQYIADWAQVLKNEKMDPKKFYAIKNAEIVCATQYWPTLLDPKADKTLLAGFGEEVLKGFRYDKHKAARFLFALLRNPRFDYRNEELKKQVKSLSKIITVSMKEGPKKEDHIIQSPITSYDVYRNYV